MILDIVKYPNSILSTKAKPVENLSEVRELIDNMIETMYANNGCGIAAPQVGVSQRVIVVDIRHLPVALINPEIVSKSGSIVTTEGCLSVPKFKSKIKRSREIVVRGTVLCGMELEYTLEGVSAIIFQHEIDHLDGILFPLRANANDKAKFKANIRKT